MARRKIRKVVITPKNQSIVKRPTRIIRPVSPTDTTKVKKVPVAKAANPEIRKTQVMHEMFLNNIKYTEKIKGDIVILGSGLHNLPHFKCNFRKTIYASNIDQVTSDKISFVYIDVNANDREAHLKIKDKLKPLMSWGSIFFFKKHEGYQAKIKSQPGKVSLTKAAKVWDDFVKDNYLYTYGSKQRPLIPTWNDIYEDYFAIKYYPNPPAIKKSNRNLKIATVFRSGGTYTQAHVDNIYNSCKKYIKADFEFYCLTDMPNEFTNKNINKVTLQHNWPIYWSKMELFKPGVFPIDSNIFYIDLDTLITNDITDIATYDTNFLGMRDFNTLNLLSSGLLKYKYNTSHYIYNTFLLDPIRWMKCRGGDQEAIHLILKETPEYMQDIFPRRMGEFINHCYKPEAPHAPVKIDEHINIVCFHGRPKMENLMNNPVITKWWRG
jgi:hypothetical protein